MSKVSPPDLTKYMDKQLAVKLNANRSIVGVLRGFDQFMNIVMEDTYELLSEKERNPIGMVVIRGNSILMMECLERL